jgi:predicted tellurium resistance membrane protein TerC
MELLGDPQIWLAFATLTLLEIVLGIDNIVFISILAERLPPAQRARGRTVGLALAMGMRILLLFSISWVMGLGETLFSLLGQDFSGRDLILIGGGLFLLGKSTLEIHANLEGEAHEGQAGGGTASFTGVIVQIGLLDIVFSLDSVITAVGLAEDIEVMVAAIVVAVAVMIALAGSISGFVSRHPTVKMLALAFLILIGTALVGEGFDLHIPKGYIYFAMAFSVMVELLNLRMRARRGPPAEPVPLRGSLKPR